MLTPEVQSKQLLSLPTKLSANNSVKSNIGGLNHLDGALNYPSMRTSDSSQNCSNGKHTDKLSPQKNRVSSSSKQKVSSRGGSRPLSTKLDRAKALPLQDSSVSKPLGSNLTNRPLDKKDSPILGHKAVKEYPKRRESNTGILPSRFQLNSKLVSSSKNRKLPFNKSNEEVNLGILDISQPKVLANGNLLTSDLVQPEKNESSNLNLEYKAVRNCSNKESRGNYHAANSKNLAKLSTSPEPRGNSAMNNKRNFYLQPTFIQNRSVTPKDCKPKNNLSKTDDNFAESRPIRRFSKAERPVKSNPQSRRGSPEKPVQNLDHATKLILEEPLKYIQNLGHISHESIAKLQENLKKVDDCDLEQFVSQHSKEINYNSRHKMPDFFALNLVHTQILNEIEQRKNVRSKVEVKNSVQPLKSEKVRFSPEITNRQLFGDITKIYHKTPDKIQEKVTNAQAKQSPVNLQLNNRVNAKKGLLIQPLSGVINKQGLHSSKFNTLKQSVANKHEQRGQETRANRQTDSIDKSWMKKPLIISAMELEPNVVSTIKSSNQFPDHSSNLRLVASGRIPKPQSNMQMLPITKSRNNSPKPGELLLKGVSNYQEDARSLLIDEIKSYVSHHRRNPASTKKFYRMEKEIAEGFYGKVMLANSVLAEKPVVVKCFDKSLISSPSTAQKIQQEISALKLASDHHGVCQFYETFEDDRFIYMVLEYVDGGDLASHIKRFGRLNESELISVLRQMISILQFLQSKQLLHRDIKLENILVNDKFEVKLCDFGIAVPMSHSRVLSEHVGTPVYLAPEVVGNKGYSGFKSDIWSLGVACYIALTGEVPFKGDSLEKLEESIVSESLGFPDNLEVSLKLKKAIRGMLEKNPEKRISLSGIAHTLGLNLNPQYESSRLQLHRQKIIAIKELGFDYQSITKSLLKKDFNHISTLYKIL